MLYLYNSSGVPVDWGDVATWVTGIATIALFIVGFLQIRNERQARIRRDREIEIRRERDQAEHISSWIVRERLVSGSNRLEPVACVAILNQSLQPIFQAVVSVVAVPETGKGESRGGPTARDQACVSIVPPGQGFVDVPVHYHGMFRRPGIEIAFQDAMGRNWIRKAMGELEQIKETTAGHYNINLPANWQRLYSEIPEEEEPRTGVEGE